MRRLKIHFPDFWPNFQPTNNYFYHVLSLRHQVEIDTENPDIIIYTPFGNEHNRYHCKRYHFTGESYKSSDYDFSFSFDPTQGNNFRLPLWVLYINWFNCPYPNNCNPSYLVPLDDLLKRPAKSPPGNFCNLIYGNDTHPRRLFADILERRGRTVDGYGPVRNNKPILGGNEWHKIEIQKNYRFTVAFENMERSGYVTEKILHPFAVQSVPIYWGCPEVIGDFNSEAFVNARDYPSIEAFADAVISITDEQWVKMVTVPVFKEGVLEQYKPEAVADFFERTL